LSHHYRKEFEIEITDEIKRLGVSRIRVAGKDLFVYTKEEPIVCQYYKDDLSKTMKKLGEALNASDEFDKEAIEKLCKVYVPKAWTKAEEKAEDSNNSTTVDNAQNSEANIINEEIMQLRQANSGITYEKWKEEQDRRRDKVRDIAELNFPHSWTGIEFTLSVLRILNICGCTLPFAGIILSRPGGNKTLSCNMIMPWPYVYYIRNFTAKAFVSHNTAV